MTAKQYKEMIEGVGYIQERLMCEFLRAGMIADFEFVSDIFNKGMSVSDYQALQEALDDLGIPDVE